MALSKMEASAALAQCLGELAAHSLVSAEISVLPPFLQQPSEIDNTTTTRINKNGNGYKNEY